MSRLWLQSLSRLSRLWLRRMWVRWLRLLLGDRAFARVLDRNTFRSLNHPTHRWTSPTCAGRACATGSIIFTKSANFLAAYEAGDEQALWQAIVYCAGHRIPLWEWLAAELLMPWQRNRIDVQAELERGAGNGH